MNAGDVLRGVRKLKSVVSNTDHEQHSIYCDCGAFLGKTHLSHGRKGRKGKKDLTPYLSSFAHQLRITSPLLREIIGCSKNRDDYLAARGHDHSA